MVEQLFRETEITAEDIAADVAVNSPAVAERALPDETVAVSVIVPIYNAATYLSQALESLCNQTLTQIEIICVDDGSTDAGLDILKSFHERDPRVRIVTQSNAGASRARNNGIRRARGEYVAFLDADDFADPTWLEKLYGAASAGQADIATCGYDLYRDRIRRYIEAVPSENAGRLPCDRIVPRGDIPDILFQSMDSYVWNKIFRRTFLQEKDLFFPEDIQMFEDTYFVAAALAVADRLYKISAVLLHHRVYQAQIRNRMFLKNYLQIIDVFVSLRKFLVSHGMYLPLRATYVNHSATRCCKVYNLLGADEKRRFWNRLHEATETLGWDVNTPGLIENTEVAEFVANAEVYTYERYFSRLLRGVSFRIERFVRSMQAAKKREKVRRFFKKVFRSEKHSDDLIEK